jgi:hypothetical protein
MQTPHEKAVVALLERIAHAFEVQIGRPSAIAKEEALKEADAAALAKAQDAEAAAKAAAEAKAEKASRDAQAEIEAAQAKLDALRSGATS